MREQLHYKRVDGSPGNMPGRSATVKALPGRGNMDVDLMRRIVGAADRSALEDLAGHYAPRLKAWLMYRGEQASTAEDIAHDVIIQVWTKADKFDSAKGTFSAWIFRMTRNCWIDHKRKHDRLQPTAPDIMSTMADSPVDGADVAFDENEAAEAVQSELAKLPLDQKQMLHLAFFEGLSHSQIAERTGLALGTVKSRIRAPLKKMQNSLQNFRGVNR